MKLIKRAAAYTAMSACIFTAGIHAAPLFAAESAATLAPVPTLAAEVGILEVNEPSAVEFQPLAEIVQPMPSPAEEVGKPTQFASLAAMVAAHDAVGSLTADEECLAVATYFESKSESLEGQHAVAHVIINRANSGRFRPTMCGVVKQPGQFSFVRGGRLPAVNKSSRDWREAVAVSKIAMAGKWDSAAPGALSFHAKRVSPGWRLKRVGTVGNHVFYR